MKSEEMIYQYNIVVHWNNAYIVSLFSGCLALSGYDVSNDVYAWIIVFALPINSAINPFLYTLMTVKKTQVILPSILSCIR